MDFFGNIFPLLTELNIGNSNKKDGVVLSTTPSLYLFARHANEGRPYYNTLTIGIRLLVIFAAGH